MTSGSASTPYRSEKLVLYTLCTVRYTGRNSLIVLSPRQESGNYIVCNRVFVTVASLNG